MTVAISETADVDPSASIGNGCRIWHLAQVREGAVLGENCIVGRGAYIDAGVVVGANAKIQNSALVYAPARLGDGVFVGPGAILTNDRLPRAVDPTGAQKSHTDWEPEGVIVGDGASIGAAAVITPGIRIGDWAMIGAGAVVTESVPAYALVVGAPARRIGWVGRSGQRLETTDEGLVDPGTGTAYVLSGDEVHPR